MFTGGEVTPARAATSAVFSGPTSMLTCAYTVFTDCSVALTRSMSPKSSNPKLLTFQSPNSCGDRPLYRSVSGMPFSSAAISVNGLKVEPPWTRPRVARLIMSVR